MNDLSEIPTKQLEEELKKRQDKTPRFCSKCRGKWTTYLAFEPYMGETEHCYGCRRTVENCTC